jgi:meiotic recombination protein SPO11
LIPGVKEIESIRVFDVRWILVIEKEVQMAHKFNIVQAHFSQATFRTLATNKYWKDSLAGKGILVTVEFSPSSFHLRI